jgi:hypothetical protein
MVTTPKCLATWLLRVAFTSLLSVPAALAGGPPFLSVEAPVDPLDEGARGAAMLLHARHCGQPRDMTITAKAEGMVDGRRQSVPVELEKTGRPGTYAVRTTWPTKGTWVLSFTTTDHVPTTTLVEIAPATEAEYHGRNVKLVSVRSLRVLDRAPTERDLAAIFRPSM